MMLWNAVGIWRDVSARRRGRGNISREVADTTRPLATSRARQRESRVTHEHDGEPVPSVERTVVDTDAFPKTGDKLP